MKTPNSSSAITIGLELGDRRHAVCVLDPKGGILKQEIITDTAFRKVRKIGERTGNPFVAGAFASQSRGPFGKRSLTG